MKGNSASVSMRVPGPPPRARRTIVVPQLGTVRKSFIERPETECHRYRFAHHQRAEDEDQMPVREREVVDETQLRYRNRGDAVQTSAPVEPVAANHRTREEVDTEVEHLAGGGSALGCAENAPRRLRAPPKDSVPSVSSVRGRAGAAYRPPTVRTAHRRAPGRWCWPCSRKAHRVREGPPSLWVANPRATSRSRSSF